MGIPNVMQTGRSGMVASKTAIATTGHNISNANTEGYTRQRTIQETNPAHGYGVNVIGSGTQVRRTERINDEYLEKQIRNSDRELAHAEEKDLALRQAEDIFNEMNGDGINRLMSRFFNEFRKLANEPNNEAVRQSVREASQALVNDFKRLRKEVQEVQEHMDSRIDGYVREINALAATVKDLNFQIAKQEAIHGPANDLQDRRDNALRKLATFLDLSMIKDGKGNVNVDIKGMGPLVTGQTVETFSVDRTPADDQGKQEGALDVNTTALPSGPITHLVKGGKLGALLEVRDQTLSTVLERLDQLAYGVGTAVNSIHRQGFDRYGNQGVDFFKVPLSAERAAEFLDLSDAVKSNISHIATAAQVDAPGDNRIAIAISGLQGERLMSDGNATVDDFYNSIISDIGVVTNRNRSTMNQQKDIRTQLGKLRDQISGVSIDEETANLMQFQHAFEASARVISVADEMMKTVLDLKRL
jgi:flagellar hook-associated protein 1 FlgK